MKNKLIAILFLIGVVFGSLAFTVSAAASAVENAVIIGRSDIPLKLWYDEEAPRINDNTAVASPTTGASDDAWERWSLPIGNGYFGANVFGRTETERIQITEKTMQNPPTVTSGGTKYSVGGLNSFSETYIDFGHTNSAVSDYSRYLDIKAAISGVEYKYGGVTYTREYFTSYPDNALIIKLEASEAGKLDFTLRPTIPYEQSYGGYAGDGVTKTGTVTSSVSGGVGYVELAGKMGYFDIDFLGLYRVYTDGEVAATSAQHSYKDKDGSEKTDTDGTITVSGAKSAYVVVTLGTDYELSSEIFTSADNAKPTKNTTLADTRAKVGAYMSAIEAKMTAKSYTEAYEELKAAHVADHSALFGRVTLDLGCKSEDFTLTTDALLTKYKSSGSTYLETLLFQYGRYLLISSSREGTMPANLQGAWNTYNVPAWACGYWHNINVQMNYWPAFSTNLAETFEAYRAYNAAYMEKAEAHADSVISTYYPDQLDKDGGNGWVIGTDGYQFKVTSDRSSGNLGFTTQLFWEYYSYTKDEELLEDLYKILASAARYITKCVKKDESGNYLITHCDSPEMYVNGVWYYTEGTTYAQTFAYLNNYNALLAAKELGIDLADESVLSSEEYSVLKTVMEQIDHYDPIQVGLSGQIKEFRDETYYGSIGDEYHHRHTSQLVGLYPGNLINSTTPAWLDAARVTLNERGDSGTAWGVAYKLNLWARIKDGERAHTLIKTLIKDDIATNLWALHPPFQIDGNFGTTAGISEMLLQSHEGYIAPLSAIPSAWSSGSYTGLVARGNFEVSAAWDSGLAKTFNIKSNKGGEAKVFYPGIAGASVIDSEGSPVGFMSEGSDLISINTEAGKTYIISGFSAKPSIYAPSSLKYTENASGNYKLDWSASSGAESYNVYVAIESAPTYALVGNTVSNTFNYTAPLGKENARLTFAVTAVKSGNESARALAYTSDAIITEYGTIPGEKAGYPYSVFAKGASEASYTYIGSYDMFNTAINAAKELLYTGKGDKRGGTAVVYMTRDSKASGDSFNNGSQIEGTVIVDLGTHALTSGVNRLIGFEAKSVGSGGVSNISRVEVRNGSLYTLTKPIAEVFSASGFTYSGTKKFELLFENVTFGRAAVATSGVSILKSRGEFTSTKKAELKAEFKDCTFSYDPQGSAITLIDCSAGGEFVKCSVTMTAGKVKAPGSTTVTLFKGSINDTITYSQNEKGESTVFEYSGEVAPIITKYGTIPTADMTSDKYFAVFARKKDSATYDYKGTFGTLLKGALNNARDMVKRGSGAYAGGEVVVYMYKDHTYQAIGSDNGSFNRAFMIDGTLTFDLGGNTITGKRARLIGFETGSSDIIGAAEDHTTTVVFKNGSILSGNPVLEVFGGSSTFSGTKTVSVAFENVTFRTTASSVTVAGARGSFASGQKINLGLSFLGCTFDYASGASFTVFSDSTSNGAVTSDVTVLGSAFKASGMDAVTFFLSSDASDSFTFEKANGKYASLELPSGSAYPEGTYNGGSLEFRRTESGSVYDIYTLDAAGLGSYLPKMSFTVSDKIIMNVYIPKDKTVSFTLDGKEYTDLSSLTVWALGDGKEYYLIEIVLPSYEAARAVALEASVLAGHETALGSFTFSLPKYAEGLMEAEDIERDLFLDLLSYVRAAYVYFGKSDAEAMAKIEELLYENYDNYNLPSFESAPAFDPEGLIGATFVLGDNPSIRFYIPSVAEAESYSFYIGDKKLSVSVGKDTVGKYINIPLGIAELSLPIICKRGESELGSYHIKSYCEWAKSINNSALERLVLRLSRYAESAKRYQTRVTVEIEYVDASGEKLAPSSVKTLALGEEYSVRSAAVSGYYARDLFVSGVADESKKISVVYKPIPSGADAELINEFLPNIVAWGDSITAGVGQNELTYANQYGIDLASLGSTATGANYTAVLKNLIASYMYSGIDIANCGVGGEATSTIAARADTESYYLYLDGEATIGSSAAVIPLAHYASGGRVGILRQGGSPTVNPVTIVGKDKLGNDISVTGTISMAALKADAPAGLNKNTCDAKYLEYTFTRNDGKTDTLEFASGARVISKASYLYDGRTAIIFMGENGGYSDAAELIRQQEEILAAVGSPEHYLIISTTSGTNESRSGIRKALSERWGERYINMGDELNSRRESYEFAGYSKADVDKIMGSIAEGSVTPLFIKDNCHPNAVGYAVIGNIVFERLYKIGAFDEIFDYYDRMNGIKTETFEFNGYTATVIRPENPNGKWIWKTEFLTAFDKAERHLLDEGYTRVYYSISNKYGSPEAVGLMKSFYHEVKEKYSLDDKCILFGFSRGGLYAFNFALAHPECVDKMYLDAPVLDLKTWPTKANNPTEFSGMLLSYGLSEEEFASFNGSPIDKLEEFFALNIPLLIVVGDSDATVPFEDNAGRLIEYAKANGHTVKYIVKPGADHHPHSLDDVTEILEFCKG